MEPLVFTQKFDPPMEPMSAQKKACSTVAGAIRSRSSGGGGGGGGCGGSVRRCAGVERSEAEAEATTTRPLERSYKFEAPCPSTRANGHSYQAEIQILPPNMPSSSASSYS
ncbi:Protein of unknown function [Gryllus bimaculatus]|nr:Protein of unknown function [Gryllus bimaculatus]